MHRYSWRLNEQFTLEALRHLIDRVEKLQMKSLKFYDNKFYDIRFNLRPR